jgi:pre-mRNA-processing factor 19
MVETYSLKEQLHLARQQLAQALYRNDAASRVIARLIKERDAARQQLAGGARVAESKSAAQMVDDEEQQQQQAGDLEAVFSRKMEAAYAALSGDRGKRVKELKKAAAPAETLLKFALLGAHAPVRGAGIVHVELLNKELAVVGCADGRVALVDLTSGTARQEVEGHRGAVKSLCASSDVATLVTVGADRALIVWHRTPEGLAVTRRLAERGEPVCVAAHPCAEFAVVAFKDARWSLLHLPSGRVIRTTVSDP